MMDFVLSMYNDIFIFYDFFGYSNILVLYGILFFD